MIKIDNGKPSMPEQSLARDMKLSLAVGPSMGDPGKHFIQHPHSIIEGSSGYVDSN